MSEAVLAFIALAWPFVAAWLVLKLFPKSLTKFVEKEIDRRSDAKLEQIKAELQGSYSTLKTSVDVLTASNSGMHPHIIEAVSELWANMVAMRDKFGGLIAFDSIILADEAQQMFSTGVNAKALHFVSDFETDMVQNKLLREFMSSGLEKCRLFCGDRLWLIFYIFRASVLRSAYLISESYKAHEYKDWRKDNGVSQLLGSVLGEDIVKQLQASRFGGLANALSRLEAEFLHEATRVMSGSKAMADSLANVQALMLLQNAKVAERGRGK